MANKPSHNWLFKNNIFANKNLLFLLLFYFLYNLSFYLDLFIYLLLDIYVFYHEYYYDYDYYSLLKLLDLNTRTRIHINYVDY